MTAALRRTYRLWHSTPILALAVILTLALGIGTSTAAFTILRSILLNPLPYPEPDRLAILWSDDSAHDVHQEGVSYPNYADWVSMNRSFSGLAFFIRPDYTFANLTTSSSGDTPERSRRRLSQPTSWMSPPYHRSAGAI